MINKIYLRFILSLALVFSLFAISLPQIAHAQTSAAKTVSTSDLQKRLAKIEEKVEARRKELGIPGMSSGNRQRRRSRFVERFRLQKF